MSAKEEVTDVVRSVCATLEAHGVPYFITGSVAASTHAEFRATNDVDIVADFAAADISALMAVFGATFHADADQAAGCIATGQSFNLIHKTTFLKVDFFPAASRFNHAALQRAEPIALEEGGTTVRVATREDILLSKLWWYRLGDEVSEVQRRDIEGIVALNRDALDRSYLAQWAGELGVADLLARFLS